MNVRLLSALNTFDNYFGRLRGAASCILRVCIWECVARRSSCSAQEQLDGGCLRHGACAIDRSMSSATVASLGAACTVQYVRVMYCTLYV